MSPRTLLILPFLALLTACPEGEPEPEPAIDADGDGVSADEDCDDDDPDTYPAALEACDGVDRDCNGTIDDDYATDARTFYADQDEDGFGDASNEFTSCEAPDGTVDNADDCDDTNAQVRPGADEICNGIDDNCDNRTDSDAIDRTPYYRDEDSDGYGAGPERLECEPPGGYVDNNDDCNDEEAAINPDTVWYLDGDADGVGRPDETTTGCQQPRGYSALNTDCDDTTDRIYPGNEEVCDDLDNDCDKTIDDGGDGCDAFEGEYIGNYFMQAQEKLGSSVINDMRCPGSFSITVDYDDDPPAQGTVTCSQSRYPGFDSPQRGTLEGEIALDGSFTWRLTHRFNSYANRSYDAEGAIESDGISFEGSGTMRPNSMSAVSWQVTFDGSPGSE